MRDERLEDQIERLGTLLTRWSRLFEIYKAAVKSESLGAKESQEFSEIRMFIARNYQALMQEVGGRVDKDDRVLEWVSQIHDTDQIPDLPDIDRRRLESQWHESHVQLNTLLGSLESRSRELARLSSTQVFLSRLWNDPKVRTGAFFAAIALVIVVIFASGIAGEVIGLLKGLFSGTGQEGAT